MGATKEFFNATVGKALTDAQKQGVKTAATGFSKGIGPAFGNYMDKNPLGAGAMLATGAGAIIGTGNALHDKLFG